MDFDQPLFELPKTRRNREKMESTTNGNLFAEPEPGKKQKISQSQVTGIAAVSSVVDKLHLYLLAYLSLLL
mgnify:FL=1